MATEETYKKMQLPDLKALIKERHIRGTSTMRKPQLIEVLLDYDAKQQLTPADLKDMLASLKVRKSSTADEDFNDKLTLLRAQIDVFDENLLYTLKSRMDISRKIGQIKKDNNVAILQTSRWEDVLTDMVAKGKEYNLPDNFIRDVFNAIHEASVQAQNEVMGK